MTGLFTEFPTDDLSAKDSSYQTVTQTVRSFLKWNPLKGFLDNLSSHAVMMKKDENTKGIAPFYCISPELSTLEGMVSLLQYK